MPSNLLRLLLFALLALISPNSIRAEHTTTITKTESFDRDPDWDAHNNRVVPRQFRKVDQNFGYSTSNFAGKSPGEMGGRIWRAVKPAYYADKIGPKTLNDRLTASGTFAITKSTPGSGIFFGFFNADQPGGGGRPVGSLGLDMDGEHGGVRLALRLITAKNQSCGTFITPFIPGKFRPTPIRNDGTQYHWKLEYDPQAANGRGQITLDFTSDKHKPGELETPDMPDNFRKEARSRFPSTTHFVVDLPDGYREQGTTFDHFGMMNMMKPGGEMEIYFDDLICLGKPQDFATDPAWDSAANRDSYRESQQVGAHDFGFSSTNFAGGKPGELGGVFWRGGKYAYYADRVGPLSLEDRLEAKGRVVLKVGAPDSDMCFGWFNSSNKDEHPTESGNFVGVHVGGPTRVGHYFLPVLTSANGTKAKVEKGPVLEPGKVFDWSLTYDPAGAGGGGAMRVTLGDKSVTLELKKNLKKEGAALDRFGVFTSTTGGQIVSVFLDDLTYTNAKLNR